MAANMVVDQVVTNPLIGQWNYVILTTPVPIDITQELWVGYYVNTTTGYPAGCDDGPAIDGYGNMMNFGGWQTLLQINPELDYNWNVQAYVESLAGATMPLSITPAQQNNPSLEQFTVNPHYTVVNPIFASPGGSRELTGFNIFRSADGGEYELIDFTSEVTYLDEPLSYGVLYCYKVTVVYQNEESGDVCESAFSNEDCDMVTAIGEPTDGAQFNLYPNPATNHVFITSSQQMTRVTVYNALGQVVLDESLKVKQYELSTAAYTTGVYMVRVETGNGISTRVLTVQR